MARALGAVSVSDSRPECVNDDAAAGAAAAGACGAVRPWDRVTGKLCALRRLVGLPRMWASGQAGSPAEFKHINKRRRRN